jgi:riboflavin synthase
VFTGIVEGTAVVVGASGDAAGARLRIDLEDLAEGTRVGDSIAIDGCCLTVVTRAGPEVAFDVVPETLQKTTLGLLAPGDRVNVERALRFGDRLGGHLVTGHVDATGTVRSVEEHGAEWLLTVEAPAFLAPLLVATGSITVAGVGLTIATVERGTMRIALVPHTRAITTLGSIGPGAAVNLEADVLGKWVQRLLQSGRVEGT